MAARRKRQEHSDPGNVITISGLGAAEGEFEYPVEDRNDCVHYVLDMVGPYTKDYPKCRPLFHKAVDACMSFKFANADRNTKSAMECVLREGEKAAKANPGRADEILSDLALVQYDLSQWRE